MNLSQLGQGFSAKVIGLNRLPITTRKKLMVMGLLPNTDVSIVRSAPLGDPLQVRIRGIDVAIRKDIAAMIDVESC